MIPILPRSAVPPIAADGALSAPRATAAASATGETRATCPYCGVGCGVLIAHDGACITGVRGDPAHPANFGRLCTKGATLHLTAGHDTRLLYPAYRTRRGEAHARIGWDAAIDVAAQRFADIIHTHGPDAVAFYISGQLLTEDYYVFNKAMKGLIGSNNIDNIDTTRACACRARSPPTSPRSAPTRRRAATRISTTPTPF
jgi:assimilatory nitrate reductase catalytic subunit